MTTPKPKRSRGAQLLERVIEKLGTYEKAAEELSSMSGGSYIRASLWHWATGRHQPSRKASNDLKKWAGIDPASWDEPALPTKTPKQKPNPEAP